MPPRREEFQRGLDRILEEARNLGKPYEDVRAGDLHKSVGGYPARNHRMPVCCSVMRKNMKGSDTILPNTLKKDGASLRIRYNL